MTHKLLKKLSPARVIALGFAGVILLGSVLLSLPISLREGVTLPYIDALYTATSAVCVTGLLTIDAAAAFTTFGQCILAMLIQIGGLGVALVGAGIMLAMGKKIDVRGRNLIREASNLDSDKGTVRFIKDVFLMTVTFEAVGAALCFFVFVQGNPPLKALGYSLFHAVSAFNNAGIDILGLSGELYNNVSIIPYQDNIMLNVITCGLIVFGGIGFLVIKEVLNKRFRWKRFSMHTKVVLSVSATLIVAGTLLLKLTEDISWMGAIFQSITARTAGFSTYSIGEFTNAGLLVMIVLMIIGASPGSTGGGIKTTTFFVICRGIHAAATNQSEKAFHYAIPKGTFKKAAVILLLGIGVIFGSTFLLVIMEPQLDFIDAFFEMTSAFGTVGLSTGITSSLGLGSKLLSIVIMYIGRLGPLTIATLWYFTKGDLIEHPDGNIAIG